MLNDEGPEERTVVTNVLNHGPPKTVPFGSAVKLCSNSMSCLDGYIDVGDGFWRRHFGAKFEMMVTD